MTEGLADLTKAAAPGELISVGSVRNAMGIVSEPSTSQPTGDPVTSVPEGSLTVPSAESIVDETPADETLEPLENLPSAGTASESVAASHATEDEDEEEDEEEEEEEIGAAGSLLEGVPTEMMDEPVEEEEEEEMSQDHADLSEFFSSPPLQEESSMDGGS